MDIKVSIEGPDSIEALNLIEEHRPGMRVLYPEGTFHPFDPNLDAAPPGVFCHCLV
jgi:hypothetical protein